MITLPEGYTAVKSYTGKVIPGYFWNLEEKWLYTMKQPAGILRRKPKIHPNHFNHIHESGFLLSINGHRKFIGMSVLTNLTLEDSVIEVR